VTTDERDVVSAMRESLAGKVGKQKFDLWFADAAFAHSAGKLIVATPNEFKREVLRTNFATHLRAAAATLGENVAIDFQVDQSLVAPRVTATTLLATPTKQPGRTRAVRAGDKAESTVPTEPPASRAGRRFADFGSFVAGASNRLALAMSQNFAHQNFAHYGDAQGCTSLLLHGPTGVGKTHLLEAIWSAAKRGNPGCRVVYLTAEQFTTMFVEAVRGSGLPNFRRKVRGADLLLIDDVQFFAGKRATLVELLYTLDTVLAEGRRVVLAADRAPAELTGLGPELITRLSGGMMCRIEPPEYETRLDITRRLALRMNLEAPEEVLSLVARRVTATAREISGALYRLQAVTHVAGEPLSRQLADHALADLFADHGTTIRLSDIDAAVCSAFGLEPDALTSGNRTKHNSHARMLAMFLARKHTRSALSEIGRFFGGRTHTTVLSAQKTVERWLERSERLALADQTWHVEQAIRRLEDKLRVG
jgi:chromosomal replication initiator protein